MKLGIIGLPNTGKSTLFNALTAAGAEATSYPFCTIEPNMASVPVPDASLEVLAGMVKPEKVTPTTLDFVDIAGLVKGAHKGEGLGNKFLSHIREVDALLHTVRCFIDENVSHIEGCIDPVRDIETVNLELTLADLESVDRRLEKSRRQARVGEKKYLREVEILEKIRNELDRGHALRSVELTEEDKLLASELFLLTMKPVLYVVNISEDDIQRPPEQLDCMKEIINLAGSEGSGIIPISAKIEEELAQLDREERLMFMQELGIPQAGMERLVASCYKLLGLISFITIKLPEVRAWTVPAGTKAPQAAGRIHTDFERGFICAEVITYGLLKEAGSFVKAKEKGLVRQEGRDYIIRDGDVILFKFNV
ncbi:MAG: redox-regulated ATPase YchF [Actinobacteria bacterium]|nr:redox-regulated ATPase YchF [Actinomycetota bacterium]